jgi:phosphoribosylformimino-5-aminoimidazole carboxamide ribotide isomerase
VADDHGDGGHERSVRKSLHRGVADVWTDSIEMLEPYCSEFLVHAADNEGLQQGIDVELVKKLSEWCGIPVTYAGGARTMDDLDLVRNSSNGKIDLTIGSALDVFGGTGAKFEECVEWNRKPGSCPGVL